MSTCLVEVHTVLDELGSEHADSVSLDWIRPNRHDDHTPHARTRRGIRQGLSMVSGRVADNPPHPRRLIQSCHQVQSAANLEGTRGVHVLVFDEQLAARARTQGRVRYQGRDR